MLKITIYFCLIFFNLMTFTAFGQDFDFDLKTLSAEGITSYQKILVAKVFALGGVGEGGEELPEAVALQQLVKEPNAEKALQSLVRKASPEGQIYTLYGFKMLNSPLLESEVAYYKSLPQLPERNKDDPFLHTNAGEIASMSGCKPENLKQVDIIKELEKNDFDPKLLSPNGKKPFETLLGIEDFSFGLVGYAAQVSGGVIALDELRKEKNAEKAFQYLIKNATPEGKLYGLVGLQIIKSNQFDAEFAAFKELPPPPARRNKTLGTKTRKGEIGSTSGCLGISLQYAKVVEDLEKRKFVEEFFVTIKYRKNERE